MKNVRFQAMSSIIYVKGISESHLFKGYKDGQPVYKVEELNDGIKGTCILDSFSSAYRLHNYVDMSMQMAMAEANGSFI